MKQYLEEQGEVGSDKVTEIEAGALSRRRRLEMVRIIMAFMICSYGDIKHGAGSLLQHNQYQYVALGEQENISSYGFQMAETLKPH